MDMDVDNSHHCHHQVHPKLIVAITIFDIEYIFSLLTHTDDLPKPMDPPVLTQPNQAVYDVELPMDLEMYMFNNPSFVFRIEHAPGQFVYQWMVDIAILDEITITDYLLDLSSFPGGSSISVSFAYVSSEMGLSSYSDPVQVVLPGMGCPFNYCMMTPFVVQRSAQWQH